ncbi:unnamed protein product [Dovyalis caffra]|uniref:Uncharacterized protein n=1 Tax=Dovyalis caffra TaxID=77055 RepID=A0AAV1RK45_9ROSI|nr:unnamed protein product [Dovyalis caffra]
MESFLDDRLAKLQFFFQFAKIGSEKRLFRRVHKLCFLQLWKNAANYLAKKGSQKKRHGKVQQSDIYAWVSKGNRLSVPSPRGRQGTTCHSVPVSLPTPSLINHLSLTLETHLIPHISKQLVV